MKRFRKIIFNALTVVSLLLCLATVVCWVRSYWVADKIQINRPAWREVASYKGRLYLAGAPNSNSSYPMFSSEAVAAYPWSYDLPDHDVVLLRWGGQRGDPSCRWFTRGYGFIGVPMWAVAGLVAVFPAVRLRRRYFRVANAGLCATCGYDLRATPDRCPECGTTAAKATA